MKSEVHITPGWEEFFRPQGLAAAEGWLEETPHVPADWSCRRVSANLTHDIWKVAAGNEVFFLKRRWGESRGGLLRMVARGRRPLSGPVREAVLADLLRAEGFAAMEPVICGEIRAGGFPKKGFNLCREVRGTPLDEVHAAAGGVVRERILRRLGTLTGRLHATGFFQNVRLKDVMVTPEQEWVLIDRETIRPWCARFSLGEAVRVLAKTARQVLRDGSDFEPSEIVAFFQGYSREIVKNTDRSVREIRRIAMGKILREVARKRQR